jgi:hypothetical protein
MQAELTQEQAIAVLTEIAERGTLAISDQARLNMVRALLSRFVLCEKEPVAWLCSAADGNVDATPRSFVREDYRRFGRTITNLYAPADIGKEGGQ